MIISEHDLQEVYPDFISSMKSAVDRGIYKSVEEIPGRYREDEPEYASLLDKVIELYRRDYCIEL